MNGETKRDLRNAIVLALADGRIGEAEKEYIDGLRRKLGLDAAEFRELLNQVRADPKRVSVPKDPQQAAAAVRLLVEVAEADGEIGEVERRCLRKLAEHIGLDCGQIDGMLRPQPAGEPVDDARLDAAVEEIYADFSEWDEGMRREKIGALGKTGRDGAITLLRMLESYRAPGGMTDALEFKTLIARELGRIGDPRAVYYLAQQATIGDVDDEITCSALRFAAAEAIGKIVGGEFGTDQQAIEAVRQWWGSPPAKPYDRVAF